MLFPRRFIRQVFTVMTHTAREAKPIQNMAPSFVTRGIFTSHCLTFITHVGLEIGQRNKAKTHNYSFGGQAILFKFIFKRKLLIYLFINSFFFFFLISNFGKKMLKDKILTNIHSSIDHLCISHKTS